MENYIKRPNLLSVLCILTFIVSGFYSLGSMMLFVYNSAFIEFYGSLEETKNVAEFYSNIDKTYFLWNSLLSIFSVVGAIFMWNLKKIGFHIYTSSKLVMLVLLPLYIKNGDYLFPFLLTLIFVLLYHRNIKLMH